MTRISVYFGSADVLDAERDIGLIAATPENRGDLDIANQNREKLTAALQGQYDQGEFTYANGRIGPVVKPIVFPAKEFQVAGGPIKTSARIGGGGLYGPIQTRIYPIIEEHYDTGGSYGGASTRIVRIDAPETPTGTEEDIMLLVRGTGFSMNGVSLQGLRYYGDNTGEGPTAGNYTPVGIGIEGRTNPGTGLHTIENCMLFGFDSAIKCYKGYFNDAGTFVEDESHADNSIVRNVNFSQCLTCFESENQQALNWSFYDIGFGSFGGSGLRPGTVFDIKTTGAFIARGLSLNHPQVTILKVFGVSPYSSWADISGIQWDNYGPGHPTYYCTLFHYTGAVFEDYDMSYVKWQVDFQGCLAGDPANYDTSLLFNIPDGAASVGIDLTNIHCKIKRLTEATADLEAIGDKYRPTSAWRYEP